MHVRIHTHSSWLRQFKIKLNTIDNIERNQQVSKKKPGDNLWHDEMEFQHTRDLSQ